MDELAGGEVHPDLLKEDDGERNLRQEWHIINKALRDLELDGNLLKRNIKDTTDEGMRKELSYQRALEEMAAYVVMQTGDKFGLRQ